MKKLEKNELFNPFLDMFKKGFGTLAYQDGWNLFDNIIVNANLAKGMSGSIQLRAAPGNDFFGQIFDRPFLKQKDGQYKNYPFRTYVGNTFKGGYSDHFPVYIYLSK